ncbi:MAG: DUF501 domain-containing protein [Candidatus Wallbacteria bacterium]|nr:DUF501 domain-containing protein [Candidatus Wallbacteria bacterium]
MRKERGRRSPAWLEVEVRLAATDREFVAGALRQVRYEPLAVADRCPEGHPRVVVGFYGRGVSTTLYWITCPELLAQISAMESEGGVLRIQETLAADSSLARAFARSQELYRRMLYSFFRRELPELDPGRYLAPVRGVGGVTDAQRVKCLHAHVAFTLATGRGPAGALALTQLGYTRGPDGRWDR